MHAPLLTASALAALATVLPAQIPAGTCVATLGATALSRPTIVCVDPLTARTTSLLDPLQLLGGVAFRATLATAAGDLLVGTGGNTTSPDAVLRVRLAGNQVTGASVFATGFGGSITGIVEMRGGGFAVGTSLGLFRVAAGGGQAQAIVPGSQGYECRDLTLAGNDLAALLADRLTGTVALLTLPVSATSPIVRPLAVSRARALGFHESSANFVVGTDAGELHALDPQTLVSKLLASPGRGGVRSLAFATEHRYFLFGTSGALQILEGTTVGPPIPLISGTEVLDLDWVPFASKFTTEGHGCAGLSGTPQIGSFGGDPFPGNASFGVGVANVSPQRQALLGLGVDRVVLDLTAFGAPGCVAWTNPLVSLVYGTGSLGKALAPLPIPPDASLAGGALSVQWFVLEPKNALGLVTSARGRVEL